MRFKVLANLRAAIALFCFVLDCSQLVAQTPAAKSPGTGVLSSAPDFGKQPTSITSQNLTLWAKERRFEYTGKVEVKQGDMTLACDQLEGLYNENNQIQKLTAKSNVVITKGDKIKAASQRATYLRGPQTITLTENPTLQQEENLLSADQITVYLNENRSEASGNVRAKVINTESVSGQLKKAK